MNASCVCCVAAIATIAACERAAKERTYLGAPDDVQQRALAIGCRRIASDHAGLKAFSCIKHMEPCGCTLVIDIATESSKDWSKELVLVLAVDLFGCPPNIGRDDIFAVLDPMIPVDLRDAFHELLTVPRMQRDAEQQQRFALVQTETFGSVHATVELGVVTDKPRLVITLDSSTRPAATWLVADAPAYGRCPRETQ